MQWKLRETAERRLQSLRTEFRFHWQEPFALGIADLDREHAALFALVDGLDEIAAGREPAAKMPGLVDGLLSLCRTHLETEESRLASRRPAAASELSREHAEFLKKVEALRKLIESAPATATGATIDFLKDWALDHTLIENRRTRDALEG